MYQVHGILYGGFWVIMTSGNDEAACKTCNRKTHLHLSTGFCLVVVSAGILFYPPFIHVASAQIYFFILIFHSFFPISPVCAVLDCFDVSLHMATQPLCGKTLILRYGKPEKAYFILFAGINTCIV